MFAKPEFIDASFNLEEPHDILAKWRSVAKPRARSPARQRTNATSSADTVAPKKPCKGKG
jgi:hypothetical protein